MIKFGYSYWGFCEALEDSEITNTPDGGRYVRPILVRRLQDNNVKVIALQQRREKKPFKDLDFDLGFPDLDILFIEWRWPTYKNYVMHENFDPARYESDLQRQFELIQHYYSLHTTIIIFDTDLKVTEDIMSIWPNIVWMEPTILPTHPFKKSLLYWSDYVSFYDVRIPEGLYAYIGSNYERYEAFERYYVDVAQRLNGERIRIDVWGNWLTPSIERQEQEENMVRYSKNVTFHSRNTMQEGMQVLNSAICTTHIGKDIYSKYGLITPRFFEALAANTIGFVPQEFYAKIPLTMSPQYLFEAIIKCADMNLLKRKATINAQRFMLKELYPQTDVNWVVNKLLKIGGVI